MLYPLSYGGASAQSSDMGSTWGGREWLTLTHVTRTAVLAAPGPHAHVVMGLADVDAGPPAAHRPEVCVRWRRPSGASRQYVAAAATSLSAFWRRSPGGEPYVRCRGRRG